MSSSLVLNQHVVGTNTVQTRITFNEGSSEFELYDYIMPQKYWEEDSSVTPAMVMDFMKQAEGDITVRINSRGGEVGSALVMYNRLKEYNRGKVTTVVDGYAFSSAGWVAMAGAERTINKGGLFMLHNPLMCPEIQSESDIETVTNQWRAHKSSIIDIFNEATGMDKEKISDYMEKETYMSADEAVENGFFTGMKNAKANTSALNCFRDRLPDYVQEMIVVDTTEDVALRDKAQQLRKKLFTL